MENARSSRRYGIWAGNPKGYKENPADCIEQVTPSGAWGAAERHQCYRKRGHGPEGLYCRQHAAKIEEGLKLKAEREQAEGGAK